jgi:hypothetical protein
VAALQGHLDQFSIQQFRLAGFLLQPLKLFERHQFHSAILPIAFTRSPKRTGGKTAGATGTRETQASSASYLFCSGIALAQTHKSTPIVQGTEPKAKADVALYAPNLDFQLRINGKKQTLLAPGMPG